MSVVERYKKLIPIIKYRKNSKEIDEFDTPECVICMEQFMNGSKVRKIPSCRHIFHDECLMKWFSGAQQMEAQKCPMCNSDITVDILEKAIEEEASKKQMDKRGIFGVSNSPLKPRDRDRSSNRDSNLGVRRPPNVSVQGDVLRLESLRSS